PWTMAPMVVAPLAGLVIDRVGPRILLVTGQALLAVALAWMAAVTGRPLRALYFSRYAWVWAWARRGPPGSIGRPGFSARTVPNPWMS
ncbi:hypothetical protein, partial [Nocardia carnea]|uniref:hypothetical protein n=1 Tax=Nocardia carnea TaxID=37328 RepID=UPI00245617A1